MSDRVFKVGSSVKADLTRLKKQFPQLQTQIQVSSAVIDLKEHCIKRGVIKRSGESGSLEALLEKSTGLYLPKDEQYRRSDNWERPHLNEGHLNYAAMDVFTSRVIFEKTAELAPITGVEFTTPTGTCVALLAQEGGNPIAFGSIADPQPTLFGRIRVKTATRSRLLNH